MILGHFWQFWVFLDNVGQFWTVLDHLELILKIFNIFPTTALELILVNKNEKKYQEHQMSPYMVPENHQEIFSSQWNHGEILAYFGTIYMEHPVALCGCYLSEKEWKCLKMLTKIGGVKNSKIGHFLVV